MRGQSERIDLPIEDIETARVHLEDFDSRRQRRLHEWFNINGAGDFVRDSVESLKLSVPSLSLFK